MAEPFALCRAGGTLDHFERIAAPGYDVEAWSADGLIAEVKVYIEPLRPVTAELYVLAPVEVPVPYSIHPVPDTSAVRAAIQANLIDLHEREAGLGDTLLISHIRGAISGAAGETDHSLTIPDADAPASTNELLTFGGITWL